MRILICALALASSALANTCTLAAGTYVSYAAAAGHWTGTGCTGGSYAPAAPDIIIIPATSNPVLHIASGETVTLGSTASGVGDAVTVTGTNSTTYGSLIVDAGATLTLRSFDGTTNRIGRVQQYAVFVNSGTVIGSVPSAVNGVLKCDGLCSSTSGALFTNETVNWTNSGTTTVTSRTNAPTGTPGTFFDGNHIYVSFLAHAWIANAANTGLATYADSSLSFSSQSCSPTCTDTFLMTAVSSLDQVTSTGKYYCDYRIGVCWWWMDSGPNKSVSFTGTYKYLSFDPWRIEATNNATYTQSSFDGTTFRYMGRTDSAAGGAISIANRNCANTQQCSAITNNTLDFCYRGISVTLVSVGTAGNPILITGNTIDPGPNYNGFGYEAGVWIVNASNSYITITGNKQIGGNTPSGTSSGKVMPFLVGFSTSTNSNITVQHNVVIGPVFAVGTGDSNTVWPDSTFSNNAIFGFGVGLDSRAFAGLGGTSGHPSTISGNLALHTMRALNLNSYESVTNNALLNFPHHGVSAPYSSSGNQLFQSGTFTGNVLVAQSTGVCSLLDLGYNRALWADTWNISHNTLAGIGPNWTFVDSCDNVGPNLVSNLTFSNNIMSGGTYGTYRGADTSAWMSRLHFTGDDYNVVSGNTTANYSGWNRYSTFSGISNVTGVMLHNPSSSSPLSGKTLTWTYTSATSHTLTWDGGTPVQLVLDNGTATAGSNSTNTGTLSDSGKSWPTAQNNASTPAGCWVKVTGGTGSGQVRRVLSNTATQLTVAPAWTTTPDATSTYTIVKSEITLTASDTSTVQAGIDYRSTPTSTQTDSAVAMALNSSSTAVAYAYSSGSLALWDAALGGSGTEWAGFQRLLANPTLIDSAVTFIRRGFTPSTPAVWCGGSDGETIGAATFCAAGKAMIAAISQ